MKRTARFAISMCWGLGLTLGCGETRTLDLFAKKPPAPAPDESCGETGKCPPDRNVCVAGQCVQCELDSQCLPGKPVCLTNVCVECENDDQCPKDKVCHSEAGRCTEPCSEAAQCPDKTRSACNAERGLCVACNADPDCPKEQLCDERVNDCIGCVSDRDCPDAGACDPLRRQCVQ